MDESEFNQCSNSENSGSYIPSSTKGYTSESDEYWESDSMEDNEAPSSLKNQRTHALEYTPPNQQH